MKTNWKRIFFWSSIGSVAIGATVTLAHRARKPGVSLERCRRIPATCPWVLIWTEPYECQEGGKMTAVRDEYVLQATPFKVWTLLDMSTAAPGGVPQGAPVYHATHLRLTEGDAAGQRRLLSRYYGTVRVNKPDGEACPKNHLLRGGFLEMSVCRVGGASNGVETGEIQRSAAPILNYRFEFGRESPVSATASVSPPG